jgi:hypothetical protein
VQAPSKRNGRRVAPDGLFHRSASVRSSPSARGLGEGRCAAYCKADDGVADDVGGVFSPLGPRGIGSFMVRENCHWWRHVNVDHYDRRRAIVGLPNREMIFGVLDGSRSVWPSRCTDFLTAFPEYDLICHDTSIAERSGLGERAPSGWRPRWRIGSARCADRTRATATRSYVSRGRRRLLDAGKTKLPLGAG